MLVRNLTRLLKSFVRLIAVGHFLFASPAFSKDLNCAGPDNWPAGMAFTHLKNAGLVTNDKLDFSKTVVKKMASKLVKKDLYYQVHLVDFHEKSGKVIQVITANDATSDECSGGPVDVYVISKHLGGKE